jgi:hypothetical protein
LCSTTSWMDSINLFVILFYLSFIFFPPDVISILLRLAVQLYTPFLLIYKKWHRRGFPYGRGVKKCINYDEHRIYPKYFKIILSKISDYKMDLTFSKVQRNK